MVGIGEAVRYLTELIEKDLTRKMVFLGGPRQSGKTTVAKSILVRLDLPGNYLNWDDEDDKKKILTRQWSSTSPIIVFDELHKFPRWKNWMKGIYDKVGSIQKFLLT